MDILHKGDNDDIIIIITTTTTTEGTRHICVAVFAKTDCISANWRFVT
jgi:hypothetical protein